MKFCRWLDSKPAPGIGKVAGFDARGLVHTSGLLALPEAQDQWVGSRPVEARVSFHAAAAEAGE